MMSRGDRFPLCVGFFRITVPGQPVGKERARVFIHRQSGRAVGMTPKKTSAHEKLIRDTFIITYPGVEPITGPVGLYVVGYVEIPSTFDEAMKEKALRGEILPLYKPDASNILKLVEDALNKIAYKDDSQNVLVSAGKYYSTDPRTEIRVCTLSPEDATVLKA